MIRMNIEYERQVDNKLGRFLLSVVLFALEEFERPFWQNSVEALLWFLQLEISVILNRLICIVLTLEAQTMATLPDLTTPAVSSMADNAVLISTRLLLIQIPSNPFTDKSDRNSFRYSSSPQIYHNEWLIYPVYATPEMTHLYKGNIAQPETCLQTKWMDNKVLLLRNRNTQHKMRDWLQLWIEDESIIEDCLQR